jgi:tRNA(Ile)-lysidine synthetase-like protein
VQYVLAVSGGIDSVVLLDMMIAKKKYDITVAHFDHGIRSDSEDDACFVRGLAENYGVPYVTRREELGSKASEDQARNRRYLFLHGVALERNAILVTAHHADDAIETIAINLTRGTGWRGLSALSAVSVARPIVHISKQSIRQYALDKRLEWVEDSTNMSTSYLRNRIRRKIGQLDESSRIQLLSLWRRQKQLRDMIDEEIMSQIDGSNEHQRYLFTNSDDASAKEMLRRAVMDVTGVPPTRPQITRGLLAVKTARPSTAFDVGDGVSLVFTMRTFIVRTS